MSGWEEVVMFRKVMVNMYLSRVVVVGMKGEM